MSRDHRRIGSLQNICSLDWEHWLTTATISVPLSIVGFITPVVEQEWNPQLYCAIWVLEPVKVSIKLQWDHLLSVLHRYRPEKFY